VKLDLLKIVFTIIIGLTILSVLFGSYDSIFWYLLINWVWLTITNRLLFKYDASQKFGRTLNRVNVIGFSTIFILDLLLLLLFAASFGTIFPPNLLETIFGLTAVLFFISLIILIYVAYKNILSIKPNANSNKLLFELILFPVGLWTITKSYLNNDNNKYADT